MLYTKLFLNEKSTDYDVGILFSGYTNCNLMPLS
jgi:hypothetical protein